MSNKVLILFSGGADSRLLLEFAHVMKKEVVLMAVDYGQVHSAELQKVELFVARTKIPCHYVDLRAAFSHIRSTLTEGSKHQYPGVSQWHVPGRNLIFLSVAFGLAESLGDIDEIWYGPDYSDRIGLFPDCYQEWVVKVNELFAINGSKKIAVRAPLLGWTKEAVLEMLKACGIDAESLYSGYGEIQRELK